MFMQPTDEYVMLFSTLCERAESMEAFTVDQKRRISLWKNQLLHREPTAVINNYQLKKHYW